MIRLTLPKARFTRVAFLSSGKLLTAEYQAGTRVRSWQLGGDAGPQEVTWPQARAVLELFKPNAGAYLRNYGFWPDEAELPSAFSNDPQWMPPELQPSRYTHPVCLHSDGKTVAFSEQVSQPSYQTRFHLRVADGSLSVLLLAPGVFGSSGDFSPDGRHLAMSNGMKVAWVWDVSTGREMGRLTQGDGTAAIRFVDDLRLVVAAGRSVRVWDVTTLKTIHKFPVFRTFVDSLTISPDRRRLLAGSRDGTVRVWDTATFDETARYDWQVGKVNALAFAPDGLTAAVAGDSGVVVWDVE